MKMLTPEFVERVKAVLTEQTANHNAITKQRVAEILAAECDDNADTLAAGVGLVAKSCTEFTSVAGRNGGYIRTADVAVRATQAAEKLAEKAAKAAAKAEAAKQNV